ncbi:dihydrofolate reductase isoform X2 [Callorhinchus milii]|uniref:dihydrofolate reductase isoform X2 n=1 Tax=Callorhinchus milii TaxID=7868 RepID=UPI0004571F1F|nr:dihydrofolate reductase isoform X2 [Callorhinchus milii]|eukprot:gi/632963571/ref/XP_007897959.1/ PREDICTED: dihydrofolate reductase isoform X2 [Callorhinchus milii]
MAPDARGSARSAELHAELGRGQSKEFKHFQRMTSTPSTEGKINVVVMGRRTWFSIPEKNRPLKDRINIVLSRELKETPKGAHYLAHDLASALTTLDSPELRDKVDLVWIIGGSALYKEAMENPAQHRIFVTRILQDFESDTFLPEIDLNKFRHLPKFPAIDDGVHEENGIQYKFEVYERITKE